MVAAEFKLVEACTGMGELIRGGDVLGRVRYTLDRYQGMLQGSGMPVPGLHRIEGSIQPDGTDLSAAVAGSDVTLRLEDGRTVSLTLDSSGRVYAEGHGPGRGCACC